MPNPIRPTLLATVAATAAVAALALAGCSSDGATGGDGHAGHGSGSSEAAGASDVDVAFATMMIPHHEQAVEMSDIVLGADDLDPDVADLAERIRAAQQPEIETMEGWLDAWGVDDAAADDAHSDHDGMLSDDEMAELTEAAGQGGSPDEAARRYLEGMIAHHEGAVAMAEAEVADGEDADAIALAEQIVSTQEAEIDEMEALLAG